MAETHFDEWIARRYDSLWPELFDPAFVEPTVDFLTELDLMARLAGMILRQRWSGWQREPFTSDRRSHISVWGKAGIS